MSTSSYPASPDQSRRSESCRQTKRHQRASPTQAATTAPSASSPTAPGWSFSGIRIHVTKKICSSVSMNRLFAAGDGPFRIMAFSTG